MFVFDATTMDMVSPSGAAALKATLSPRIRQALELALRSNAVAPESLDQVVVVLLDRDAASDTESLQDRFGLTPREAEVALLLAKRMSSKEISQRLGISVHTARRHTERILAKLGVRSRNEVRERLLTG